MVNGGNATAALSGPADDGTAGAMQSANTAAAAKTASAALALAAGMPLPRHVAPVQITEGFCFTIVAHQL